MDDKPKLTPPYTPLDPLGPLRVLHGCRMGAVRSGIDRFGRMGSGGSSVPGVAGDLIPKRRMDSIRRTPGPPSYTVRIANTSWHAVKKDSSTAYILAESFDRLYGRKSPASCYALRLIGIPRRFVLRRTSDHALLDRGWAQFVPVSVPSATLYMLSYRKYVLLQVTIVAI